LRQKDLKKVSLKNQEFYLLTKKFNLLKEEVPITLKEIDFNSLLETKKRFKDKLWKPALASVSLVILIIFLIGPMIFSPKFEGLNKKAIAKEKEMIKKQILFKEENQRKAELILKNL